MSIYSRNRVQKYKINVSAKSLVVTKNKQIHKTITKSINITFKRKIHRSDVDEVLQLSRPSYEFTMCKYLINYSKKWIILDISCTWKQITLQRVALT